MGWLRTVAVTGAALAISGAWARATDVPFGRAESAPAFADPTASSLGNSATAGLGVGIKSSWLRADVTIDYTTPVKHQSSVAVAGDTPARIQPTMTLVNGYLDLGTWYHAVLEHK